MRAKSIFLSNSWQESEGVYLTRCQIIPSQLSYLVEANFGDVDVAVAHLHVDPQALHH